MEKQDINAVAKLYFENKTPDNCEKVVLAAEPLVKYFIKLYGGECNYDDLYQTGMEGLLKALNGFDPQKDVLFSTWASHCIMSAIRHYVRKEISYSRPGCIIELQAKVSRYVNNEIKKNGEPPPISEIAESLGVTEQSIAEVMRAGLVSLDELEMNNIRTTQHTDFRLPIEERIAISQAMSRLTDTQKKVIKETYYGERTQEQIAKELGVNQRKVSRIKQSGLEAMAESMRPVKSFRVSVNPKYSFKLISPKLQAENNAAIKAMLEDQQKEQNNK